MKVNELKTILQGFDPEKEVFLALFGDYCQMLDIDSTSDNNGHLQLNVYEDEDTEDRLVYGTTKLKELEQLRRSNAPGATEEYLALRDDLVAQLAPLVSAMAQAGLLVATLEDQFPDSLKLTPDYSGLNFSVQPEPGSLIWLRLDDIVGWGLTDEAEERLLQEEESDE